MSGEAWRPLDLSWVRLNPWGPLAAPVIVDLDGIDLYGFAAMSAPLPPGRWTVRLRLGPVSGAVRLVTADAGGERREPRSEVFAQGSEGEILAQIDVPADFTDMGLVIQKRGEGPGSVAILGVDLRPRP